MHVAPLKHGLMLFLVTSDGAVIIGRELDGSFAGIVDWRKSIHQSDELLVVVIVFLLSCRFRKKRRIESTQLSKIWVILVGYVKKYSNFFLTKAIIMIIINQLL